MLSLVFVCQAQVFFDFKLDEYLISDTAPVNVEFFYDLKDISNEDFVVKPKISNAIVKVFDAKKSLWGLSAPLRKNMQIRVEGLNLDQTNLFFEIRNLRTSEVYKTPTKPVWGKAVYGGYVESINSSVLEFGGVTSQTFPEEMLSSSVPVPYPPSFLDNRKNLIVVSLLAFVIFGVVGFVSRRGKID
jgi:hypothetical protein